MTAQTNISQIKPSSSEYQTLNNSIVSKAMARQKEYFLRDTQLKGFYVRVKPSGTKTFGVQGRLNPRDNPKQRTIGSSTRYTVKEAREIAREWLQLISKGVDPKHFEKGQITLSQLLAKYIETKTLADRTESDYLYNFKHYLKNLGKKSIGDITTDDLVKWYVSGKEHPVGTERTFVTVKTVMNFAMALDYIDGNPAVKAAAILTRHSSRKSKEHLSSIYKNLASFMKSFLDTDISLVMRDWIVLAIGTGLRKEESMTIKWEQVDLEEKVITIPKNKTMRYLQVPMVGLTYDMFQLRHLNPEKDKTYVFTTRPGTPIKDARKALKKICNNANIPPIAHHDLRRLFASVCHELNLSEEEIGKLLNHSTNSVTDLYVNRSLSNLRTKYQSVVDHLDRQVPQPKIEGQNFYSLTATDLMRSVFYGKVAPSPDSPITEHELQEDKLREAEYWEGT